METLLIVVFILGSVVFVACRVNKYEAVARINQQEDEDIDTFNLMYNTVVEMGCQPTKDEENALFVKYQGEEFHIKCGGLYARVWELCWGALRKDAPEVPNIRTAVNDANYNFGPTVVIEEPEDDHRLVLHSRYDIMFSPSFPNKTDYLEAVLDSFFTTRESLCNHFRELNLNQDENAKKRRPIGFRAIEDEEELKDTPAIVTELKIR